MKGSPGNGSGEGSKSIGTKCVGGGGPIMSGSSRTIANVKTPTSNISEQHSKTTWNTTDIVYEGRLSEFVPDRKKAMVHDMFDFEVARREGNFVFQCKENIGEHPYSNGTSSERTQLREFIIFLRLAIKSFDDNCDDDNVVSEMRVVLHMLMSVDQSFYEEYVNRMVEQNAAGSAEEVSSTFTRRVLSSAADRSNVVDSCESSGEASGGSEPYTFTRQGSFSEESGPQGDDARSENSLQSTDEIDDKRATLPRTTIQDSKSKSNLKKKLSKVRVAAARASLMADEEQRVSASRNLDLDREDITADDPGIPGNTVAGDGPVHLYSEEHSGNSGAERTKYDPVDLHSVPYGCKGSYADYEELLSTAERSLTLPPTLAETVRQFKAKMILVRGCKDPATAKELGVEAKMCLQKDDEARRIAFGISWTEDSTVMAVLEDIDARREEVKAAVTQSNNAAAARSEEAKEAIDRATTNTEFYELGELYMRRVEEHSQIQEHNKEIELDLQREEDTRLEEIGVSPLNFSRQPRWSFPLPPDPNSWGSGLAELESSSDSSEDSLPLLADASLIDAFLEDTGNSIPDIDPVNHAYTEGELDRPFGTEEQQGPLEWDTGSPVSSDKFLRHYVLPKSTQRTQQLEEKFKGITGWKAGGGSTISLPPQLPCAENNTSASSLSTASGTSTRHLNQKDSKASVKVEQGVNSSASLETTPVSTADEEIMRCVRQFQGMEDSPLKQRLLAAVGFSETPTGPVGNDMTPVPQMSIDGCYGVLSEAGRSPIVQETESLLVGKGTSQDVCRFTPATPVDQPKSRTAKEGKGNSQGGGRFTPTAPADTSLSESAISDDPHKSYGFGRGMTKHLNRPHNIAVNIGAMDIPESSHQSGPISSVPNADTESRLGALVDIRNAIADNDGACSLLDDPGYISVIGRRHHVRFPPPSAYATNGISFQQVDALRHSVGFTTNKLHVTMTIDERKIKYEAAQLTSHQHLQQCLAILDLILTDTTILSDEEYYSTLSDTLTELYMVAANFVAEKLPPLKAASDHKQPPPPGGNGSGGLSGSSKPIGGGGPSGNHDTQVSNQQPGDDLNARRIQVVVDTIRSLADRKVKESAQHHQPSLSAPIGSNECNELRSHLHAIFESVQDGQSNAVVKAFMDRTFTNEVISALLHEESAPAHLKLILADRQPESYALFAKEIALKLNSELYWDTCASKSIIDFFERLQNVIRLTKPLEVKGVGGTTYITHYGTDPRFVGVFHYIQALEGASQVCLLAVNAHCLTAKQHGARIVFHFSEGHGNHVEYYSRTSKTTSHLS